MIREVLAFDAVDFGTRVSIGLMYRTALAVQGVEWVDLNWLSTVAPTHAQEIGMDADYLYQSVNEVVTDALLIPRIWPLPPIFTATVTKVEVKNTNVATLTTASPHNMSIGQTIDVSGVTDTPTVYNGQFKITAVPTTNSLTYTVVSGVLAVEGFTWVDHHRQPP